MSEEDYQDADGRHQTLEECHWKVEEGPLKAKTGPNKGMGVLEKVQGGTENRGTRRGKDSKAGGRRKSIRNLSEVREKSSEGGGKSCKGRERFLSGSGGKFRKSTEDERKL